jgi:hypothetical protein
VTPSARMDLSSHLDLAATRCKPGGGVAGESLLISELGIAMDNVLPVVRNGVAERIVAGEGRILFPAFRQAAQAAKRECLHHRFLEPLARGCRLRVRLPAIGEDVAELMAKLIGELRPRLLADVDDNPGHATAVGV